MPEPSVLNLDEWKMTPTQYEHSIGKIKPPSQADPNDPFLSRFDQKEWSQMEGLYHNHIFAREMSRVASSNSEEAKILSPLMIKAAEMWNEEMDAFRVASAAYPKVITAARWSRMTNPEKFAMTRKLAHQALLKGQGLTKDAVQARMAFMVYKIDQEANNSKFYEGLIKPEGRNFRVVRRWGGLTDSGETGRIDGAKFDYDDRFLFQSLPEAQRELKMHEVKRLQHGYVSAFGPDHQTRDGRKLPMGEYPVGLTRAPSFGWGTQSITQCIPALKKFRNLLGLAIEDIKENKKSDIVLGALMDAQRSLQELAHDDSTMAAKLLGKIEVAIRRVSGSPRFLPDPDGLALGSELATMLRYVEKQTDLCGKMNQ